ncbi:CinA family protein [Microbacterium sp. STN6]|uniref:CinA family protein n=1 Tax=Microbacterium sp. STN6 TaxID=2995588 RepID=UPI002260DF3E|nr:CinA family protein [Microbacterium sp. STN6]MCX7521735.1 CinA family protein [Microbacterium sp. STN6]
MTNTEHDAAENAAQLSEQLARSGRKVAVAESLTSGAIASCLGAAESSSEWFLGGVVAYDSEVKYRVLGVERGPVVCETAARQMASGVARLLGADIAIAVTGVGGPDRQEGQEPGTVFIGVWNAGRERAEEFHFAGDPTAIVQRTVLEAVRAVRNEARTA